MGTDKNIKLHIVTDIKSHWETWRQKQLVLLEQATWLKQ